MLCLYCGNNIDNDWHKPSCPTRRPQVWDAPELCPDPTTDGRPPSMRLHLVPAEFATDEQIADAVNIYAAEMMRRGVDITEAHIETLCRAARIQDIWRVALARAVK